MSTDCISYQESGYFTPFIHDYLDQKKSTQSFYHLFPTLKNFGAQLEEKKKHFDPKYRETLVAVLQQQYKNNTVSSRTQEHINLLLSPNTFTVTTGHQLNLFTGPLYFLYKIISTINLAKEIQQAHPEYHVVPVYWMATEDHDFEEINHFLFNGKKIVWNKPSTGPVGRQTTEGLQSVLETFSKELGLGKKAQKIKELFKKTYLEHQYLTDATRYIANELFGAYGLVCIDADDVQLKRNFIPYINQELQSQTSYHDVTQTIQQLKPYPAQVNPREINLFYIENNLRERIIKEGNRYRINQTHKHFSESEILEEVVKNPEKFSPNVILRPLYQEVILPNLCYIGGGGEIAYWLELKTMFTSFNIPFPILLVRNSVVLATQKQAQKAHSLQLHWNELFLKQKELIDLKTKQISKHTIDFSEQKQLLEQQFEKLFTIAKQTDASFMGAVAAQKTKQIKGLENLEKRLLKAEKRKYQDQLERIVLLQNELFPNQSLQERKNNFSEYYIHHDDDLIKKLMETLKPLAQEFNVVVL